MSKLEVRKVASFIHFSKHKLYKNDLLVKRYKSKNVILNKSQMATERMKERKVICGKIWNFYCVCDGCFKINQFKSVETAHSGYGYQEDKESIEETKGAQEIHSSMEKDSEI